MLRVKCTIVKISHLCWKCRLKQNDSNIINTLIIDSNCLLCSFTNCILRLPSKFKIQINALQHFSAQTLLLFIRIFKCCSSAAVHRNGAVLSQKQDAVRVINVASCVVASPQSSQSGGARRLD